jgi:hypothetical protein
MRFLAILLFTWSSLSSHAQKDIKLEELREHIGDSVKVQGKIYGVRYLETSKNTPTFINIGAAYPNQLLTVVIWGDVRSKLPYKPEEKLKQGLLTIYGKVELFKDKPQIVISNPDQLVFKYDEEVSADKVPPIEKKKDNRE